MLNERNGIQNNINSVAANKTANNKIASSEATSSNNKKQPARRVFKDCPKNFPELKDVLLSVKDPCEKERRKIILESIERKLATQGAHRARPGSNRARQFMPFAALKGYSDMVQQAGNSDDSR